MMKNEGYCFDILLSDLKEEKQKELTDYLKRYNSSTFQEYYVGITQDDCPVASIYFTEEGEQ